MKRYNTVLVTGGSRGLGAALGLELATRGYQVILVARSAQELRERAEAIHAKTGARVESIAADLSRPAEIKRCVAEANALLGPIDVLINNAGIGTYKPLTEWSTEEITQCLQLNLTTPVLLTQALLPGWLTRKHGMVVNVASDLSRRYLANMAPYVASKAGLLGFAGSLLREVKSQGIKVTTILPGIIDTAFNGAREGEKQESWSLRPTELAARIVDVMELPEHVVIDELTIHPMQQEF
jgi:short-subunit dehydrogenase